MRKYLVSLSAIFILILSSCQKIDERYDELAGDDRMKNVSVVFDEDDTRCAESHGDTYLGETMVLTESGDTLYVTAYLTDMEEVSYATEEVDTRSTLIGSGNFGTATGYESFKLNVYKEGESTIYNSMNKMKVSTPMQNVVVSYTGGETQYKWSFDKNYFWPTDGKSLYFCSFGPNSEFDTSGSASNLAWNKDTHTFSFKYTTPTDLDSLDAQKQMDIIAGVNSQAFNSGGTNNIVLSLKHPLMAVRFVLGNLYGKVEYLSLNNFNSEGTASITTSGVSWSNLSNKKDFNQFFDNFDATKYTDDQKAAGTVELDQTTGKTRNFIIIPQQLESDAAITLKMGNNLHPITLSFDKIIGDGLTKDWTGYAGKVLTFRISSLKANLVSVDITDDAVGCVKSNIKIINDGKSPLYIRAVLVGNWLNWRGNVLAAWDESLPYGKFDDKDPLTDATAFPNTLPSNWYYNKSDGFYYYKKIIPKGYRASQNLFDKFELTDQPAVENSEEEDVQLDSFEMAILVQAVAAIDPYGGTDLKYNARTAWGIDGSFLTTDEDKGAANN